LDLVAGFFFDLGLGLAFDLALAAMYYPPELLGSTTDPFGTDRLPELTPSTMERALQSTKDLQKGYSEMVCQLPTIHNPC
jgi:hypothetical protein